MTISQDSIYYETDGHVADDVTCRKWWLFKETHVARIPVRLPACFTCNHCRTLNICKNIAKRLQNIFANVSALLNRR